MIIVYYFYLNNYYNKNDRINNKKTINMMVMTPAAWFDQLVRSLRLDHKVPGWVPSSIPGCAKIRIFVHFSCL